VDGEAETFQRFLRTQGLKLTSQRGAILDRALSIRKHFSAEELFESLREDTRGISKATVYRTLALLVQAGLLDEHDFERGHKLYERATNRAHHDHLICVSCGRIVEFHSEEIERIQDQVATTHEFEMVSHTHQIFGVCPRCRRDGEPRPRRTPRPRAPSHPA
jgi:Fur family transcriptional regulator, ferric uptake regulator